LPSCAVRCRRERRQGLKSRRREPLRTSRVGLPLRGGGESLADIRVSSWTAPTRQTQLVHGSPLDPRPRGIESPPRDSLAHSSCRPGDRRIGRRLVLRGGACLVRDPRVSCPRDLGVQFGSAPKGEGRSDARSDRRTQRSPSRTRSYTDEATSAQKVSAQLTARDLTTTSQSLASG
jgi:hypothetical protein